MPDITREDVVTFIENMTVLELSQFVKDLQERFGVSAAMPMAMPQGEEPPPKHRKRKKPNSTSFSAAPATRRFRSLK